MPYVSLRGVSSYHETTGEGPPLVLLHGGFCSLEVLRPLARALSTAYQVYAAERPGHGRTPDRDGAYSYDEVVSDTLAYLDAMDLTDAHVVGYSDGAVAGLLLGRDHPDRVRSLVTISANLDPGGFVTEDRQDRAVPADAMRSITAQYADLSPDGAGYSAVVSAKLHAMWAEEPDIAASSLTAIVAPTLVIAGQHDMVALEHTALIAESIPAAQLAVVPGTSHLLVLERPQFIGVVISDFLSDPGDRGG